MAIGRSGWRDEVLRRLLRNVGYLVSGNAVASLLGLGSLALTARVLGPEGLGFLALIEAYVRLIDRMVRFEPWQAVIKYGAEALEQRRPDDFRQLLKFGALMDAGGALFAAAIAVGGVFVVGPWFGWAETTGTMAAVYGSGLVLSLAATPTAVLRLFDRFGLFAWVEIASAALRLGLVVVAWAIGAGLWEFVLIALAVQISRHLALVGLAWGVLGSHGYADFLRQPLRGLTRRCPGIWNFVWTLNLAVLIRKSTRELDTLIVGGLLDPAAVGLYHVAKRLGDAALKIGVPIQQAIFPDVARLWARREIGRMRRTVRQVNLAAGGLAAAGLAIVAVDTEGVLGLTMGAAFAGAALPLLLQMAAVTLALGGITLRPALFSMGLQRQHLHSVVVATAAFYVCLFVAVPTLGVSGASLAHVAFNGIWLATCCLIYNSQLAALPVTVAAGTDAPATE